MEQTRELIAVHNLTERNLEDAYDAGTLPTVAALSESGDEAGEISLLFDKENGKAPQRAMKFDEVRAAIVPDNMNNLLRRKLELSGLYTVEYPAGDEQARLEALNSMPEARFSVEESFADEIDQWDEDGRQSGETFILGSTGDVLQGLGAIESDIYMMGDKIDTILREHPEMTLDEIKKIPEILDDPVLILKSRNVGRGERQNTRLVIFGTVKAKNGKPIMSV